MCVIYIFLFFIYKKDNEYRQGIRILEFLRKKQAETAIHAMRVSFFFLVCFTWFAYFIFVI